MRILVLLSVLALCGCSASRHHSSPSTSTTTGARARVTTRLELRARSVAGGSTLVGALVVDNETGHPIVTPMCAAWEVEIANEHVPVQPNWFAKCGLGPVLAEGVHRYPFTTTARYACGPKPPPTGPCGNDGPPPLPVGTYDAVFVQTGMPIPAPAPVSVTVVSPHAVAPPSSP